MIDPGSLIQMLANLQHNAKIIALATLAFYIAGDAVFSMVKNREWFNWNYATAYISKFANVYLGLVVMAVMGQYVAAVDLLFWGSVALYSKAELTSLLNKMNGSPDAPVPAAAAMGGLH